MHRTTDSPPPRGAVFALLLAFALGLTGCGTLRIHRPQDQARAEDAQSQFQAADLADTVTAERTRLAGVLTQELAMVKSHTLALRDARLVYVIGQGDTLEAWSFLEHDLKTRLAELGIDDTAELKDYLRRDAEAAAQLETLKGTVNLYAPLKEADPELPALNCPALPGVAPPAADKLEAAGLWDDYTSKCKQYLATRRGAADGNGMPLDKPLANGDVIAAMTKAKQEAQKATEQAEQALADAQQAYAKSVAKTAGQPGNRDAVRTAAKNLIARADKVKAALDAFVQGDDQTALNDLGLTQLATDLGTAKTKLSSLGLDLSAVVGDLSSLPAVAKLEASHKELVAGLSSTLHGKTANDVFASLQAIGVALDGPKEAPLSAMVLKEKQLQLDIQAGQNREAFFDKTLALLREQEAAYRDELAFLGQAELRRLELENTGCLSNVTNDSKFLKGLVSDSDPKTVHCKELVFRLLVQYSAAWTLGRVASEQIDYKLIALHQESALDTSEIAFQKWASLLGPPIDQLVAFSKTGITPSEIASPIVNALGLGAVAAGVN